MKKISFDPKQYKINYCLKSQGLNKMIIKYSTKTQVFNLTPTESNFMIRDEKFSYFFISKLHLYYFIKITQIYGI